MFLDEKMKFEDRLRKWNGGISRGAATKFAQALGVGKSAVSMWLKGLKPGEQAIHSIAKLLGISPQDAEAMWPAEGASQQSGRGLEADVAWLKSQVTQLTKQLAEVKDDLRRARIRKDPPPGATERWGVPARRERGAHQGAGKPEKPTHG